MTRLQLWLILSLAYFGLIAALPPPAFADTCTERAAAVRAGSISPGQTDGDCTDYGRIAALAAPIVSALTGAAVGAGAGSLGGRAAGAAVGSGLTGAFPPPSVPPAPPVYGNWDPYHLFPNGGRPDDWAWLNRYMYWVMMNGSTSGAADFVAQYGPTYAGVAGNAWLGMLGAAAGPAGPDPMNVPNALLGITPDATLVETGPQANASLVTGYPPGDPWIVSQTNPDGTVSKYVRAPVPGDPSPWTAGINGGAYTTIKVNGVDVIDPNSLAIVRDWRHPATPPTTTPISSPGSPAALVTQMNSAGLPAKVETDDLGRPVVRYPENTPDNIAGIAANTRTVNIGGRPVSVIDPNSTTIIRHW